MEEISKYINECLNCKNPTCIAGCPLHNNIPKFISLAKENKIQEAYNEICKTSCLSQICSSVCPSENQCVGHCIKAKMNKPVNIPLIEKYISTNAKENIVNIIKNNKKVAIIGSGPAGITAAIYLAKKGYNIDVFDRYNKEGGILRYGIPSFVLDKKLLDNKIEYVKSLGVNFILNKELNKDIFLSDLVNDYDAIFLAFGTSVAKNMNIEGSSLKGIIDANEFLCDINEEKYEKYKDHKNIIVIGGGNTAIDAARSAKKYLSDNVTIVYRRGEKQMPARVDEISKAKADGINFNFLSNPIRYLGNEKVCQVECIKMELVDTGESRLSFKEISGSNFIITADLVIEAISSGVDNNLTKELKTNKWNTIEVNENMQTSIEKVFAAGDCVSGPSLVVLASRDAIKTAECIDNYLKNK